MIKSFILLLSFISTVFAVPPGGGDPCGCGFQLSDCRDSARNQYDTMMSICDNYSGQQQSDCEIFALSMFQCFSQH